MPASESSIGGLRGRALSKSTAFPHDVWTALAARGAFRVGLPAAHGGDDKGYAAIAEGEAALVGDSGALGLAMSWTGHQLVARHFFVGFGNAAQLDRWLPGLSAGTSTCAVAISEPDVGAHPRDLKTTARLDGDGWIIDGEKAWVTNGPIADLFIVLAITAVHEGRKRYSAFLVPRDATGLELIDMPELRALRPSQHCRLRLVGCRVAATAMLGPRDRAYEAMALPFRDVEDAVGVSGIAGLCRYIVEAMAHLAGRSASPQVQSALGEIAGLATVLKDTSVELAGRLDRADPVVDDSLLVGARALSRHLAGLIAALRETLAVPPGPLATACDDLAFSLGIARGPRAIKQARLGASLAVLSDAG